jgi:hypothetical protein
MRPPRVRLPVAAALLSSASVGLVPAAQAQIQLTVSDGVLGAAAHFQLQAAPGTPLFGLLPSFQGGPTPLSILDPNDPRVLGVGLDLLPLLTLGSLSPAGQATVDYPLPASPVLAGLVLYTQAVTLPGVATLVDQVSNRTSLVLGLPGSSYPTVGADVVRRRHASGDALPDGRVLVAGGQVESVSPGVALFTDRVSRFDPDTQSFADAGFALPTPRARHRSTVLDDGRILLTGGLSTTLLGNVVVSSCVLIDPQLGTATAAAPMSVPRIFHSAVKLPDGRVWVAGGSNAFNTAHPIGWPGSTLLVHGSTEIYDPTTNSWSPGPSLARPTTMHGAVLLGTGQVLLFGGVALQAFLTPFTTDQAYLFHPASNQLSGTAPLPDPRQHTAHTVSFTGTALVMGGADIDFGTLNTTVHKSGFEFDPTMGTWNPLPDAPGLIRCGQLTCVENGIKIYYLMGMGLSSLDLPTGAASFDANVYVLDQAKTAWGVEGTLLQEQMGGSMVPIDQGLRTLILGPGQGGSFGDTRRDVAPETEILIDNRPPC